MSSYLDAENVMRTYQKERKKNMEFSREKLRQIRRLMILAAFLILIILYSEKVFYGAAFLFGILKPFLYGGAIAFVLNIPMRGIENKWLGGWRGKASDKLKRPVSMVITLVLIALVFTVVVGVVLPQMARHFRDRKKDPGIYPEDDGGI